MKKSLLLSPLALGLLAACAPAAQRAPTAQIYPQMYLNGNTVQVILLNAGPYAIELENTCPRPFAVNFTEYPGRNAGGLAPRQLETCLEQRLPPLNWAVGKTMTVSIPISYAAGTYTLKAFATVRGKVLQPKGVVNNYADMNVKLPDLTFEVK